MSRTQIGGLYPENPPSPDFTHWSVICTFRSVQGRRKGMETMSSTSLHVEDLGSSRCERIQHLSISMHLKCLTDGNRLPHVHTSIVHTCWHRSSVVKWYLMKACNILWLLLISSSELRGAMSSSRSAKWEKVCVLVLYYTVWMVRDFDHWGAKKAGFLSREVYIQIFLARVARGNDMSREDLHVKSKRSRVLHYSSLQEISSHPNGSFPSKMEQHW